jgi:hypothetical protein
MLLAVANQIRVSTDQDVAPTGILEIIVNLASLYAKERSETLRLRNVVLTAANMITERRQRESPPVPRPDVQ